jgi:hypothetical protein
MVIPISPACGGEVRTSALREAAAHAVAEVVVVEALRVARRPRRS